MNEYNIDLIRKGLERIRDIGPANRACGICHNLDYFTPSFLCGYKFVEFMLQHWQYERTAYPLGDSDQEYDNLWDNPLRWQLLENLIAATTHRSCADYGALLGWDEYDYD